MRVIVNRRAGDCARGQDCKRGTERTVQAGEGRAYVFSGSRTWNVAHVECLPDTVKASRAAMELRESSPRSVAFRTSGGTFYRNAKGTCIDAPCCGCCTF